MELPPFEQLDPSDRDAYLTEDILWIESASYSPEKEGWARDGQLSIDLGWYGSAGVGRYRLCVLRSWDDVVIRIESADQYHIRDCLDRIFWDLWIGVRPEEIRL